MFARLFFAALLGAFLALAAIAPVQSAPYAAMVMDARNGEVLHARNADTRLHPASLTKMMTLYIAFEAIRLGEIDLDTEVRISRNAAAEPPSKLGLGAGSTIRLRYLIRAAAVRSANDAATAIGEAISGSEAAFARRMTRTARALGMTRTTFRNAHGLTEEGHLSTARDMTLLGRRMVYDYPQYYNIFSRVTADAGIAQVRNTNRAVLTTYRGADGIKTGYTRAAGFNLVASAQRGQERIIATVFGGQSGASRNARIMELLDMGFERAPSEVALRIPGLPTYAETDGPIRRHGAPPGQRAVTRSLRPVMRPGGTPERQADPAFLAAIDAAVGEALSADLPAETTRGTARPDDEIAAALEAAGAAVEAEEPVEATPLPRPEPQAQIAPETIAPVLIPNAPAPEPEIVTRASTSGSRLFGVSLGHQATEFGAQSLLLRTALAELGLFDTAPRRVIRNAGGFEARFLGMTEEQAQRACARLSARAMACDLVGPEG